jgi:U32 family peptidase
VAEIILEASSLKIGDEIIITGETTGVYEDFISEMRTDMLANTQEVHKGEVFSIPVKSLLRRGDKVYRLDKV